MVYGCDAAWWIHRKGLPEYPGLKVCWGGNRLPDHPDILRVKIAEGAKEEYANYLVFEPGVIGGGMNSGFQALNLAVAFGCRRIALAGFDLTDRAGIHWYGRNTWNNASNPSHNNFRKWAAAFETAAETLREMGVKVINLNSRSELKAFPFGAVEDIL